MIMPFVLRKKVSPVFTNTASSKSLVSLLREPDCILVSTSSALKFGMCFSFGHFTNHLSPLKSTAHRPEIYPKNTRTGERTFATSGQALFQSSSREAESSD